MFIFLSDEKSRIIIPKCWNMASFRFGIHEKNKKIRTEIRFTRLAYVTDSCECKTMNIDIG